MLAWLGLAESSGEVEYRGDESDTTGSESEDDIDRGAAGAESESRVESKAESKKSEKQSVKAGAATTRSAKVAKPVQLLEGEKRGQCGLEDESDLVPYVQDRIRASLLQPGKVAKYQALLGQIFSVDTLLGKRLLFEPDDVMDVMLGVIKYIKPEPMLIEDVPFDVVVVGDLHGQFYDLERIFSHYAKDGKPGWECRKFLFLGDYVDRGRQSLEIIMALFIIKMLHPDRIWLLRGNHEFIKVNSTNGFQEEMQMRYNFEAPPADMLYYTCNSAFTYLSVAAIVGNTYLCAHGGVSPRNFTRRAFRGIYKPQVHAGKDNLINDVVWSDPAKGLDGSCHNGTRNVGTFFGLKVLANGLASMNCKAMIRGHTQLKKGFETSWECMHAIFSATNYGFTGNKGAVADIDANGKMSFCVMEIDPKRTELETSIRDMNQEWDADDEAAAKTIAPLPVVDEKKKA